MDDDYWRRDDEDEDIQRRLAIEDQDARWRRDDDDQHRAAIDDDLNYMFNPGNTTMGNTGNHARDCAPEETGIFARWGEILRGRRDHRGRHG